MAIVVNRMRDGIGYALAGASIGYIVSCCLPPFGWPLLAPLFSVWLGARFDIALIVLMATFGPAFVTAWLARLCPFRVKPWMVVCVGTVLTAGTVWAYVSWLYNRIPDGYSGPLFG